MGEKVILELPWPPSVNHYYRHVGPRVLISKEGRTYRDAVATRIRQAGIEKFVGDVELNIQLYPPDNRRRDVDNVLKCVMDTLTIGGLYEDDSQVKYLSVVKFEPMPPDGMAVLQVGDYMKKIITHCDWESIVRQMHDNLHSGILRSWKSRSRKKKPNWKLFKSHERTGTHPLGN